MDRATIVSNFSTPSTQAAASRRRAEAATHIASLDVFQNFDDARRDWLAFERDAVASPYQTFAFARIWSETIGAARQPMIVVARDALGRTLAILPLAIKNRRIGKVAEFIGGKDANFKMPLFRPDFSPRRDDIEVLLRKAARLAKGGVDLFALKNQPRRWQGAVNPLSVLRGQPSPSFGYRTELDADFETWFSARYSGAARKKFRSKERRLAAIGELSHSVARDDAGADEILGAYFAQKERRMRAEGFSRFGDDATISFLTRLARGDGDAPPVMEAHALRCGEKIVATFCGARRDDRFCGMVISYDAEEEIARCSPGDLLLNHVVADLLKRGVKIFDLGAGEARYKSERCEGVEELFDSFVPATPLGHVLAVAERLRVFAKRAVKQTPWAFALAGRLRKIRGTLADPA